MTHVSVSLALIGFIGGVAGVFLVAAVAIVRLMTLRDAATDARDRALADAQQWRERAEVLMDQHLVRSGVSPVLHPPASPAGEGAVGLTMRAFGVREIDSSKRKQAG